MKNKEKQLTAVIEKVLRDTQNCDMSIETLTDYLVDRIKDKVFPEDSVVLSVNDWINFNKEHANELIKTREEEYGLGYKKGSKETAEKFAKLVYEKLSKFYQYDLDWKIPNDEVKALLNEIAKQFGVEIKE